MGVITGRACAVFSKDLPRANALGSGADIRGGGMGRGAGSNAQGGRGAGGGSSDRGVRDRGLLAGDRNASESSARGERGRGESVSAAYGRRH
jgi:hypothetical protein